MRLHATMAYPYSCMTLDPKAAESAYSLVEAAGLNVAHQEWLSSVHASIESPTAGVMGVQTQCGRIHGVYLYDVKEEANGASLFHVPFFIAFEIHGPSVTEIMITSAEQMAARRNCDFVEIHLDHVSGTRLLGRATGGAALFTNSGYNVSGLRLRKPLRELRARGTVREGSF